MHLLSVALLVLGALTVSYADDNLDSHEVLKRLLSALTEKTEEKPAHRSLWDELEEELTKRKEVVNNILSLFGSNILFIISKYIEESRISVKQIFLIATKF